MPAVSHLISSSLETSYNKIVSNEIFGYTKTGTYRIAVLDALVADGDTLRVELDAVRAAYTTKGAVFAGRIAGHDYINGRVTSVSEAINRQNGDTEVTVSISESIKKTSAPITGSFFAMLGAEAHLAEGVTESYTYNRSGDTFSYNKSINIKFSSLANIVDFKALAVIFKDKYKLSRKNLTTQVDGISDIALVDKKYDATFNESIDLENFSYQLTEDFQSNKIDAVNNCSISESYTDTIDESGYLQRVVTANLTSLKYTRNTTLKAAIKAVSARIITDNNADFAKTGQTAKPISIEKGFTVDGKNATVSMTFSNRPEDVGGDIVSYSCNKVESSGIITYSLNISFKSTTGATKALKYANTKALYKLKQPTLNLYVEGLFPEAVGTIFDQSNQAQFDPININITQNTSFNAENIYYTGTEVGILKYDISVQLDNVETDDEEHRHSIEYDFTNLKDFFASNKKGKTMTASGSLSITFSDLARDSILAFIQNTVNLTNIENKIKEVNKTSLGVYSLQSDETSVSFTGYTASRNLTFSVTE